MPKRPSTAPKHGPSKSKEHFRRERTSMSVRGLTADSLVHDPYHSAIAAALSRPLDPDLFEACAADLLREIYPSLTPLRGGSDRGRDGVVAPEETRPFPLITTIGKDAKANLLRNLGAARRGRKKPTRAVFATSRRITPQSRDSLERAAESLGVRWLQVFDQDWFANALYRHRSWAQRLLNISGRPSALSVLSLSARPSIGSAIIGRETILTAIREIQGDVLFVGAPGSGKTFILGELARMGEALFLTDSDREAIANAVRSQQPASIIVDDAHVDASLLPNLRQLRTALGASFTIIAVSWPADADYVQTRLGVASNSVVQLPDIDLDTMVEVVKSVGLKGPNQLIGSIVRQAGGRAGLAATLAELCLRGDARDVWTGTSLVRDLLPMLSRLAGEDVAALLACFAIGGSSGVSIDKVAGYLNRPLDQLRTLLARVGTAGVIRQDTINRNVSVWPEHLRWLVVRDVFYADAAALDPGPLLEHAEDHCETAMTLLGAYARGASIPGILDYLTRAQSVDIWRNYSSLGVTEARYVIRHLPAMANEIAATLLLQVPEEILPGMLTKAVGDNRELHSNPSHPLRIVKDWICSPPEVESDRVRRAEVLLDVVESWWRSQGLNSVAAGTVAVQAACLAFDPDWDTTEADPGSGRKITLVHGTFGPPTVRALHGLWRERRHLLSLGKHAAWKHAISLVYEWHRGPPNVRLSSRLVTLRRQVSRVFLQDIALASRDFSAVQREVRAVAHRLRYKIETTPDDVFDTLFPIRDLTSRWRQEQAEWTGQVAALVPSWLNDGPEKSATKIAYYEREAASMGINWPRLSPSLFSAIAAQAHDPVAWIDSLLDAAAPADLVHVLLQAIAKADPKTAATALERCLNNPGTTCVAAATILSTASLHPQLVERALQMADAFPEQLETWCLRGDLPMENLERALTAAGDSTAIAAAIGEWCSAKHENRGVRAPLLWREAVLRSAKAAERSLNQNRDHWLGDIVAADSIIAFDWLVAFLTVNESYPDYTVRKLAKKAIASLDPTQRRELLQRIDSRKAAQIPISALVGTDMAAYVALLARSDLADFHLRPLEGAPSPEWRDKAIAALNNGYSTKDVLGATRLKSWSWTGDMSDMWKERKEAFDRFRGDSDARIAAIAHEGSLKTQQLVEEHLKEERDEAVYGRARRRR